MRIRAHPVARAAAGFTAGTTVVKAFAFLKEAVVAATFGVGASMDTYLMALVVIGFPSGVLLNALQTVLIREYAHAQSLQGDASASRLLRAGVLLLCAVLTLFMVLWLICLPEILSVVGHGLSDPARAQVTAVVYRLVPYYYLNGLNLVGYGVLQARHNFRSSALIPILTPILTMVLVAASGARDVDLLVNALTLGTLAETASIGAILIRQMHASSAGTGNLTRAEFRSLAWGTVSLMPGTLLSGLSPVIEQSIASGLGHGAISALGYAAKLPGTLNSLLTTAVGVTVLPYFTTHLAHGEAAPTRRFFVRYAALLALSGCLLALVAVLCSSDFVRIAFQRGAFSPENTHLVTRLQQAYLWQMSGTLVGAVATRFIAAQGRYRLMSVASLISVPLTGLVQWGLATGFGPAGLAFGTSVGATLSGATLMCLALAVQVKTNPGRGGR
jgi:putative peptidoglycan lipid II flippase